MTDFSSLAATLMQSRQTILPKRLVEPGPNASQLDMILAAAATAPDHGQLLPWRFIVVPQETRGLLADEFVKALCDRDPNALPEQVAQAREKAYRAPMLMLVVVNAACGDPDVDLNERVMSAGCAVQNMLLMATAQGLGSALTSGKALKSAGLRSLFLLDAHDHALCFVSMGTVVSRKAQRARPTPADYVNHLSTTQGVVAGVPFFDQDMK